MILENIWLIACLRVIKLLKDGHFDHECNSMMLEKMVRGDDNEDRLP